MKAYTQGNSIFTITPTCLLLVILGFTMLIQRGFAAPRPPHPPWPQPALKIYSWDSEYWKVPWGSFAVNEENAMVAESWSGYALVREGMVTPVVVPVLESAKTFNVTVERGTIRFWFAPNWSSAGPKFEGKGPGHLARLAELVNFDGKSPQVQWSLYVNGMGDTIYLTSAGKKAAQDILKAPVAFEAGDWQMVTLCYSDTNTTLSLDGELVAQGEGLPALADGAEKTSGLVVGSDALGTIESAAEGQFEELTTFAHPLRKSDWQNLYFQGTKCRTFLGPLGTKEAEQLKVAVLKEAGILPENYGMMLMSGNGPNPQYLYASNALWLEIISATNTPSGQAELIVHGTIEDVAYEILSKEDLTNSLWAGEQIIIGVGGQDWTPATIEIGTRTNNLFFWARSLVDTDGDGLPDWWETENGLDPNNPDTGDTGVSDGYKDGDNDGWTNLQEYQNGTKPNQFNTPPAPQGLFVKITNAGAQARLSWATANGPVTGYVIERSFDASTIVLSSSATSYTDNSSSLPTGLYWNVPSYRIRATYAAGSSYWSGWQSGMESRPPAVSVHPGTPDQILFAAQTIPPGAATLRFGQVDLNNPTSSLTNVDLSVVMFTNGIAILPEPFSKMVREANSADSYMQWISSNQTKSAAIQTDWLAKHPLWRDGRVQLKQNLSFLLRSASPNQSFRYTDYYEDDGTSWWYDIDTPATYAYAGLVWTDPYGSGLQYAGRDELLPYLDNYTYRNFAFDATNLTSSGRIKTGITWENPGRLNLNHPPGYELQYPSNADPISPLLSFSESRWTSWVDFFHHSTFPWEDAGITIQGSNFVMTNGLRNLFGLSYLSFKLAWGSASSSSAILTPTTSVPAYDGYFYPETAEPQMQTVGYYFGKIPSYGYQDSDLLPGHLAFSPTNTSPLLITGIGQAYALAGFAKQAVTNGYSGAYGYLGQYFDKAFKIATNGVVTTNQTGILSPYGEFFPTEPGPTALVTMPDLDTNERGTATVHVVKVQLDVNHDGVMDLSFTGHDNTSPSKPFRFWVNNDYDGVSPVTISSDPGKDYLGGPNSRRNYSDAIINCQRDLEDFARLWICGMPTVVTNPSYQVTMSWASISGNPAIKLYRAVEVHGSNSYLTDTNTAVAQAGWPYTASPGSPNWAIGEVTVTNTLTLPSNFITNSENNYFLFEGAGIGSGELVLTISHNGTVLSQTSAFLDLRDVKDMFEHAHVESVITTFPSMRTNSTSTSTFKSDSELNSATDETKQFIFLAHGFNNEPQQSENYAQTMFKRLYWHGYQGRFAALRWPTLTDLLSYNKGEYVAFRSAAGASAYFNWLRTRFPDYSINAVAHSMGNIVMMEALTLQLAAGSNALNNYALLEAAVPAHCYDVNAAFCPGLITTETPPQTPNTYLGYPGAITNALQGNMFNFFNTNDFALTSWVANQLLKKPDGLLGYYIVPPLLPYLFVNTPISDPREIMSFCSRPRSYAVGAQPGVLGMIHGDETDLAGQFGFGDEMADHSGQFTRSIQQVWGLYFIIRQNLSEP